MGCWCKKTFLIIFGVAAMFIGIKSCNLNDIPQLPEFENTWWGKGKAGKDDTTIKPFKINIDDKVLTDLKDRLKNARPFQVSLEGTQQQYGMNSELLQVIVDFWKTKYDWRSRETFLNQYPQFTTQVQGLNIHYIHVKPLNVPQIIKVLPMLLLHGWPGSVREFYDIIPLLTKVQPNIDFVFELIVPSLPGYGFSEAAIRPGLGVTQMAVVLKNLMTQLGFKKYYIQGGDWGATITKVMAQLFPENILGVHSNMCSANGAMSMFETVLGSNFPRLVVERNTLGDSGLQEFGYMHLQATKPDTVGFALNDSPVGLAAYILEKFTSWTNITWQNLANGGLTNKYTYTDLLDNVMIYWVTNSITTTMRLYSETFNKAQQSLGMDDFPVTVPASCARFRYEFFNDSTEILKSKYINLVQTSDYDDGGHFAAFEIPKILAADIWSAVVKMRTARKIAV